MVPNGWKSGRVQDVISGLESGVSVNAEDRLKIHCEKAVLKISSISYGSFNDKAYKVITDDYELSRARTSPKMGQVIISRANTYELVGASAYIEQNHNDLFLPDKLWQTISKPGVDMKWLSYALASDPSRYILSRLSTGTSYSMRNITKGELLTLKVLIPPLPEQRKIAKILGTWDKAITTTEKLITTSKQQKKALMQQLLTGKKRLLNPETGKVFGGEWENKCMSDLLNEVKRKKIDTPNMIELLTVKLHHKGVVASGKYPNATKGGRPYYKRNAEELIIGRQNLHNGGIAIVPKSCDGLIASNAISSFNATENADINFILSLMSTLHFIFIIDNLTGGTGQKEISIKELLKIKQFVPKLKEQQKIASVLTAADKEIELLDAKLSHLKQEKKALMQQLLTGKKRVKVDESEAA